MCLSTLGCLPSVVNCIQCHHRHFWHNGPTRSQEREGKRHSETFFTGCASTQLLQLIYYYYYQSLKKEIFLLLFNRFFHGCFFPSWMDDGEGEEAAGQCWKDPSLIGRHHFSPQPLESSSSSHSHAHAHPDQAKPNPTRQKERERADTS